MNETLQLEAFLSPLLEDMILTKKKLYINNILSSLKGLCSVKSNMIFNNNNMSDILFEKGKKLLAVYIPIENEKLYTNTLVENIGNDDNIIQIIVSLDDDIFIVINNILTILNRRTSKKMIIQSNNF